VNDTHATIQRLRRILDVTRQMAAQTDLDALLATIIDAAREVLGSERATLFLFDAEASELYSRVATGTAGIRFPATAGIAGTAAQTRQVVNVPDAYADPRFNRDVDRRTGFRTRNLLTIPLENLDGALIGVLQVLNKRNGAFDADDEELARTLGAQAGVALHRATLLEEYAEKQRLARDLDIARSIQQAYLPKANPQVPGWDIAGWNRSADETGGDCYDFIALPDGRLGLFLADATGHGIGAALVIAQCRSLLRALLSVSNDLRAVAARVNDLLEADISEGRFVTAFIGVLDPAAGTIEYVSAGQAPLLLIDSARAENRDATGLPLGVMPQATFEVERVTLRPGALFVLLTDGFYEAAAPSGELFAVERVCDFVQARAAAPLERLIADLHEAITHYTAHGPQADDLTAVLVRRR
jgi:sigma-B regulation protein RsbU (phosphoserine phosphatase)